MSGVPDRRQIRGRTGRFRPLRFSGCNDQLMTACSVCGHATHERDRNVRFRLPDPVLDLPNRDDTEGTWKTDPDPNRAVMMAIPSLGGFVRALLPVHLTGGDTVTFGVWVAVQQHDLKVAYDLWWDPDYPSLRLSGRLANSLPGWNVLAAPVDLAVVNPDATPYCVGSTDSQLSAVLGSEWDHAEVISRLPN